MRLLDKLIGYAIVGSVFLAVLSFLIFVVGGCFDIANGKANNVYAAGPPFLAALCLGFVALALHGLFPFCKP